MTIVQHYSALLDMQYVESFGGDEVSFLCPKESLESFKSYLLGLVGVRVLSVGPFMHDLRGEEVLIYNIYTDGISDADSGGVADAFNSSLR
jgi:hypothetical protein